MGSRGRSIRLRIYFLVAIPLITMLGLFGYVAYTSITNYTNLDRAPSLIRATSEPLTSFVSLLQAERRAAVVYLSQPTAASLTAYKAAIQATGQGELALQGMVNSAATRDNATAAETSAINAMVADVRGITVLQSEVASQKVSAFDAFAAYTKVITDQDAVFQAETGSMTQTVASTQGFGLISAVNAREDLSEQDALLAGALAAGTLTGESRVAFSDAAGRQTDDTLLFQALFTAPELKTYNTVMAERVPAALQTELTEVQQGVESGLPLPALQLKGLTADAWQQLTKTWQSANFVAATDAANSALGVDQSLADNARNRVWETAAVGAAGLILTLIVTILLGRSINRRLTRLRRSALALANEQLPAVVARLRRGEPVDVDAQAPSVLGGSDEIGQVGQAIDAVRQTAIKSAVEEARVRRGVNDMFRNLARRNQSLLQRQLTVLDDMERRATDPDVLEDLFKMDHLTTRMRRHAEGLIILSGAVPGRGWSGAVKLMDVMRGAVAEVEDYARVTVASQSKAALAGPAVTDVIHLLAELIENSTTLSPPFTQVRVGGESVAHGFAIEIEDRGLGMTAQRLAELNDRLANPPDLNPANTEQLGLFVVGQLAKRHGISVTLRPSPYGGTTAVVLIPRALIVEDSPAALTTGGSGPVGAGSYGGRAAGAASATTTAADAPPGAYAGAAAGAAAGAFAGAFAARDAGAFFSGSFDSGFTDAVGGIGAVRLPPATPARGNDLRGLNGWSKSQGWAGPDEAPEAAGPNGRSAAAGTEAFGPADNGPGGAADSIRISGALRYPGTTPSGVSSGDADWAPHPAAPYQAPARRSARSGTGTGTGTGEVTVVTPDVTVVTGVPVSRPTPAGSPGTPFDVFTPIHRDERGDAPAGGPAGNPYPQAYPDFGGQPAAAATPAADATPAGARGDAGMGDFWTPAPGASDPGASDPGATGPRTADPGDNGAAEGGEPGGDSPGLPRRVRQASLAPELRASTAAAARGSAGVPRASAESLTVMRNTLSAMQRGWQQGRSQAQSDTEGNGDGD